MPLRHREESGQLPLPLFSSPQYECLENTRRFTPKPASVEKGVAGGPALSVVSLAGSLAILTRNGSLEEAAAFLAVLGVHELGHLAAARWLGIPVNWPVFLGPFGAFITLRRPFASPVEEAWVGVAGPVAGVLATVAIHSAATRMDSPALMKAAMFGYILHVFNLIPAGVLDGGRIAALLGRWLWVPGCLILCWYLYKFADWSWGNCLFLPLLLLPAVYRAWQVLSGRGKPAPGLRIRYRAAHYWGVLVVSIALLVTCAVGVWRTSDPIAPKRSADATQSDAANAATSEEPRPAHPH